MTAYFIFIFSKLRIMFIGYYLHSAHLISLRLVLLGTAQQMPTQLAFLSVLEGAVRALVEGWCTLQSSPHIVSAFHVK